MSKSLIPILSYCIITATSLTSIASCADLNPENDDQEKFLFSKESLLVAIPIELRKSIERYNEVDPETRKYVESLQNPLYIDGTHAHFSSWSIYNSERLSLIIENPAMILKVDEKIDWDPRPNYDFDSTGTDHVTIETFRTYPQNTTFNTYKTYYYQ